MKWDIDRELARLEPERAKGTTIQRVLVDTKMIGPTAAKEHRSKYGHIKLAPEERARDCVVLWSVGLGYMHEAKAFFYGKTIREAFLQARKAVKAKKLAEHTPWGKQAFTPSLQRPKKSRTGSRTGSPSRRPGSP
jgi:hypothetical protein